MTGIVTGRRVLNSSNEKASVNGYKASSFLFDYNSSKSVSHLVYVEPCQTYQISTFGLKDDKYINVHRIYPGGGSMPTGAGCICQTADGKPVQVLANEPFLIDGKPVRISNKTGVLFLNTPGVYMFEVNDKAILGQFLALIEDVSGCTVPSGLVIGTAAPERYVGTIKE